LYIYPATFFITMTYQATLDNLARILTGGISILFAGIMLVPVFYDDNHSGPARYGVAVILLVVYTLCYALHPVRYVITSQNLLIYSPLKNISFDTDQIIHVELLDDEKLKWTIRTFAVGGLFGYFGKFVNSQIGNMTWYATRRKSVVLVQTSDHKNIILTPDNPAAFVDTLKTSARLPA
jgi:hypothetical protein